MAVPKEAADGKICEASAHAYMSVREASTGVKIPEKHALKNKTIVNVPSKDIVLKEHHVKILEELVVLDSILDDPSPWQSTLPSCRH